MAEDASCPGSDAVQNFTPFVPSSPDCRGNRNDVRWVSLARSQRRQGTHYRLRSWLVARRRYDDLLISEQMMS